MSYVKRSIDRPTVGDSCSKNPWIKTSAKLHIEQDFPQFQLYKIQNKQMMNPKNLSPMSNKSTTENTNQPQPQPPQKKIRGRPRKDPGLQSS